MQKLSALLFAVMSLAAAVVVLVTGCGCGGAPPVVTVEADDVLCSVDVAAETVSCIKDGHQCSAELGPDLTPTNIKCVVDGEI